MPSNDIPHPPVRPSPENARGSLWPVLLALAFGFVLFLGLAAVAGALAPVVLVVGVVLFVLAAAAAGHYLLWGYWLSDSIRREVEAEEEERRRLQE